MFLNLKTQKFMDSVQRLSVLTHDAHPSSLVRVLELVGDLSFQSLQYGHASGTLGCSRALSCSYMIHLHHSQKIASRDDAHRLSVFNDRNSVDVALEYQIQNLLY